MARKRERFATGLSINDIMSIKTDQLKGMNARQQREIVSRLVSASNKRLRNIAKSGIITPASIKAELSGGKFSVKGKSENELINEFIRAKNFLKSKTSSIQGYKKIVKGIENQLKKAGLDEGSTATELMANAYSIYDVLAEFNPSIKNQRDKYKIANKIAEIMETSSLDVETVLKESQEWLMSEYLKAQEEYNDLNMPLGNSLDDYNIPERLKRG